jgi:hypothetical protein
MLYVYAGTNKVKTLLQLRRYGPRQFPSVITKRHHNTKKGQPRQFTSISDCKQCTEDEHSINFAHTPDGRSTYSSVGTVPETVMFAKSRTRRRLRFPLRKSKQMPRQFSRSHASVPWLHQHTVQSGWYRSVVSETSSTPPTLTTSHWN